MDYMSFIPWLETLERYLLVGNIVIDLMWGDIFFMMDYMWFIETYFFIHCDGCNILHACVRLKKENDVYSVFKERKGCQ